MLLLYWYWYNHSIWLYLLYRKVSTGVFVVGKISLKLRKNQKEPVVMTSKHVIVFVIHREKINSGVYLAFVVRKLKGISRGLLPGWPGYANVDLPRREWERKRISIAFRDWEAIETELMRSFPHCEGGSQVHHFIFPLPLHFHTELTT